MNGGRVTVGVVGLGYWGPNLARNFAALADCELAWCCDADPERRARFADQFRSTRFTDELDDLLSDPALDAVNFPRAFLFMRASAIWLRAEFPVQRKRTVLGLLTLIPLVVR